ncbi:MAG: TonB-dependent receptor [Neisseriaceae bacterium]|nr:TonB-dependent receptor [Neisseriaceae bacterium]
MAHTQKPPKAAALLLASLFSMGYAHAADGNAAHPSAKTYQIAPGDLGAALNRFARESGATIVFDPAATKGLSTSGLSGPYSVSAGLHQLIGGHTLDMRQNGSVYSIHRKPTARNAPTPAPAKVSAADSAELDTVQVIGSRANRRDAAGHARVYDSHLSTVYRSKEEVERFKGAAPADVFKGMVGVNSGDARNSGALDPNIRGIQGQGRVPLTIDGTEQSITVWRGYNGANNRNYIDPMLIGGITVEKGPSLTRGINSSVGGAVAITTLSVDDVIKADQDWGIDVKIEASNNAVKPRLPSLEQGVKVNGNVYDPNYNFNKFFDSAVMVNAKQKNGGNSFGQDQALRLAAAKKWANFDLLAAYVYRDKGNHIAGKNGADFYRGGEHAPGDRAYWDDYTKHLAEIYKPGHEVPNTSNQMQSLLFKGTWRPSDDQALQLGVRHTWSEYGEILPSRIASDYKWVETVLSDPRNPESFKDYIRQNVANKFPQWPLSKLKMTALNLNHKWHPDNPYINLESNLWTTQTKLDTHTAGGYPREDYPAYMGNKELAGVVRNTSLTHSKDKRWGLTSSNKMQLASSLDLTIGGSYQHETLSSNDDWYRSGVEKEAFGASPYRSIPREGWRKEWDLNFNFDWRPTDWLEISAGARKNGYSSYDEQLNRQRRAKLERYADPGNREMGLEYELATPQSLIDAQKTYDEAMAKYTFDDPEMWTAMTDYYGAQADYKAEMSAKGLNVDVNREYDEWIIKGDVKWQEREDGRFYKEDSPLLDPALIEAGAKPSRHRPVQLNRRDNSSNPDRFKDIPKQSNSGDWQPVIAATAWVSDNARVYARYAKTQRMPSIFESTIGFSAGQIVHKNLKPEKSTNIELGYVHDLSELLHAERHADVKIAWFKNTIKDVIDRDTYFNLSNRDKQIVSGLELQSRYDNGRFFADFSASYFLKNKVCDSSEALTIDPYGGSVADCVKDGFLNSYLRNMTPPKYAFNLTLGGRLMNQRLELGTRILHHAGSKNTDKENFGATQAWESSVPIHWGKVTTIDAWVNYHFKKDLTVELVGTNLTNQYYLDPLTRSHFPAPGRTLRFGVSKKF